jgi:hypothetical protein
MRFKKIKKRFLEKKYWSLLQNERPTPSPVHNTITTVGIVSTAEFTEGKDVQQLISENFNVRNTKIYSFRQYRKENEPSYKHFSENDFNWKGQITDSSLQAFLDTKFDLLITIFDQKNVYLEYVTLLSKATFKVGFSGINQLLFDLEIQANVSDLTSYTSEAKKYLQILNRMETNS